MDSHTASMVKFLISVSHFMIWVSSVIVVGITGYFLNNFPHDQHLIFEMVISALVLGFYLPSFVLPFLGTYKPYYLPVNFIFSYLWLTCFIFAAQDYNESSCVRNAPRYGKCSLKFTNEAFIFLAFFFTLIAFIVDTAAYKRTTEPALHVQKERPSVENQA